MNKKFFCALTIAGMLMSPVSVLAEEMEEVEAGSVTGSDVEQQTQVKLDEVNFPDSNFRAAVINALNNMWIDGAAPTTNLKEGDKVSTKRLGEILSLSSTVATTAANTTSNDSSSTKLADAADVVSSGTATLTGLTDTAALPFKDLTGIEYLTGLTNLTLLNSPQLKVADLSKNENLETVIIAPMYQATPTQANGGTKTAPTAPASTTLASGNIGLTLKFGTTAGDIVASDLYSITLPEEKGNLTTLMVVGASQLTEMNLSGYNSLTTVDLQLNNLAELEVSGVPSLELLNIAGNDLVGLDLSAATSLGAVDASNNNLYELELPSGKNLEYVIVANNKLTTLDIQNLKSLKTLSVADNRLESLDVSNNAKLANLDARYNHLATFDVTGSNILATAITAGWAADVTTTTNPFGATGVDLSNQYLYANEGDTGIDLASYDENFQAKDSKNIGWDSVQAVSGPNPEPAYPDGGSINKNGIFEFSGDEGGAYKYAIGIDASTYMTVNIVRANLMNRLYNPNSGEHFYTKDLNEKDVLVGLGWQDEGIGWVAPLENATGVTGAGEAVFRLYNPNAGDHHYTLDSKEKDTLVRAGWDYEGVGWYSAIPQGAWITGGTDPDNLAATTTSAGYSIEVYREYNPNAKEAGAHNYTTSENENDVLVSLGWLDEGIGWRALK